MNALDFDETQHIEEVYLITRVILQIRCNSYNENSYDIFYKLIKSQKNIFSHPNCTNGKQFIN